MTLELRRHGHASHVVADRGLGAHELDVRAKEREIHRKRRPVHLATQRRNSSSAWPQQMRTRLPGI
jgi:hypothetical protein